MTDAPDGSDMLTPEQTALILASAQCDDEEIVSSLFARCGLAVDEARAMVRGLQETIQHHRKAGIAGLRERLHAASQFVTTNEGLRAAQWLSSQYMGFTAGGIDKAARRHMKTLADMTPAQQLAMMEQAASALRKQMQVLGAGAVTDA